MIRLPIQCALTPFGTPIRIRGDQDASGGWIIVQCVDVEDARRVMRSYPRAEMPCWKNPAAAWNATT